MQWVRELSGLSLVVPYYHIVSDAEVPHVSHLYRFRTVAEFTADIEFLLRHFKPVTLTDIVDALNGTQALSRPCFHLTFDDGFAEMHNVVAPILERMGVPATFFLTTAFLDGGGLAHHNLISLLLHRLESRDSRPSAAGVRRLESLLPPAAGEHTPLSQRLLSIPYAQSSLVRSLADTIGVDIDGYVRQTRPYLASEQVSRLLAHGFSIGAHSHDHPLYADLTLSEQLAQTRSSMQLLDKRFGVRPKAFAFPHTDRGVDEAFFTAAFSEPVMDVSFGTAGLVSHFHPRNLERVSMEKTQAPAVRILARQFARAVYVKLSAAVR